MAADAVRGDDDVLALLDEMTSSGGGFSSSTTGKHVPQKEHSHDVAGASPTSRNSSNSELSPALAMAAAHLLSPPSNNPRVEIIRHRCHEKFKANFYDLFRSACSDPSSNGNNNTIDNHTAKRNQYIKSIVYSIWKSMPPHNVWERFQFSLKTLEADCVREEQEKHIETNTDVGRAMYTPPWCRNHTHNDEPLLQQLICPTVHQVNSWIIDGRSKGTIWEPLLPVPSISSSASDYSEDPQEINQKYRRGTLALFQEEIKFQFRRTFKQQQGGGGRKNQHVKGLDMSLDSLYSSLKELNGSATSTSDEKDDDTKKKAKKSKKKNKSKGTDENEETDIDKEEFVLQTIFDSTPFQRVTQKLHKKFHYLADESYNSGFLSELQKYSNRLMLEEQSRSGDRKRKRKNGKNAGGNSEMPKISFADTKNDHRNGGESNVAEDRQLMVAFAGLSLKINETHKNKLHSLYQVTLSNLLGGNSRDQYNRYLQQFPKLLFTILLRYDALEGAGLQSAIPPTVFRYLNKRFGCEFESFASPFNCWYDRLIGKGGKYGSAFGDTDAMFGSKGSFFGMDFLQMARESEDGGCFQANPPFASEFIEKMCHRMDQVLTNANGNNDGSNGDKSQEGEKSRIPLMFVIFVPAWSESPGWKTLSSSPHVTKHILLSQKDDVHYYAEGTQHRRALPTDSKGSHRIASFDTSVFFLQNDAAREKWALADSDESMLKTAFAMNPVEEAENVQKDVVMEKTSAKQAPMKIPAKKAEAPVKQKQNKKKKKIQVEPKTKGSSKKKKLMTGGNDEMNILASMGILDNDFSKNENENQGGRNSKKQSVDKHALKGQSKSASKESKGGKRRKRR